MRHARPARRPPLPLIGRDRRFCLQKRRRCRGRRRWPRGGLRGRRRAHDMAAAATEAVSLEAGGAAAGPPAARAARDGTGVGWRRAGVGRLRGDMRGVEKWVFGVA